jgi:hypothetical protein
MASSSPDPAVTWFARNLRIVDRAGRVRPLVLNQPQLLVHRIVERQRAKTGRVKTLVLKARREGVSTYTAARFYRDCATLPHLRAFVMAHRDDSAGELAQIYETFWTQQPPETRPPRAAHARLREMVLDEPQQLGTHNSRITVHTAGQTILSASGTGRASTLQRVHMSECGYYAQGKVTVHGLLQAADGDGTEIIGETTGKGMVGWFYETWRHATDNPETDWELIFLPWWIDRNNATALTRPERDHMTATLDTTELRYLDTGVDFRNRRHKLTLEQLRWRRSKIHTEFSGDVVAFAQEYPATPKEAFVASGDCYFDLEALDRMESDHGRPPSRKVSLHIGGSSTCPASVAEDPRGSLWIWSEPDIARNYVIGADVAAGVGARARVFSELGHQGGHDSSAAYVIDPHRLEIVAAYRSFVDTDLYADVLWCLGWFYNHAMIGIETNGPGAAALEALRLPNSRRPGYTRIMPNLQVRDRLMRPTRQLGWNSTEQTRQYVLSVLKGVMRSGELVCPDIRLLDECRTFINQVTPTGKVKPGAAEGAHDDQVMAAGIGVWVAHYGSSAELIDSVFDERSYSDEPYIPDPTL